MSDKIKSKNSVLTLRLNDSSRNELDLIMQRTGQSASSKTIILMIERYSKMEDEIQELRRKNRKLNDQVDDFKSCWKNYNRAISGLDALTNV